MDKKAQIAIINFKDSSFFSMARLTDGINDNYKYSDYDFINIIYIVNGKIYYYK